MIDTSIDEQTDVRPTAHPDGKPIAYAAITRGSHSALSLFVIVNTRGSSDALDVSYTVNGPDTTSNSGVWNEQTALDEAE